MNCADYDSRYAVAQPITARHDYAKTKQAKAKQAKKQEAKKTHGA